MSEIEITSTARSGRGRQGFALVLGGAVGLVLGIALDNLVFGLALAVAIASAFGAESESD